jgi:fatty acid desaturase
MINFFLFSKQNYLKMSEIAWPTVSLFIVANILGLTSYLIGSGIFLPFTAYYFSLADSPWAILGSIGATIICFLLSSVCSYAQFTVVHDAIHRSVTKNRQLNDWIGWAAQWWLGPTSNWWAIRDIHLTHHQYVNDPHKDPDYWCSLQGPGGRYLTPLRWLTVDLSYLMVYIPKISSKPWTQQFNYWWPEILKYGCLWWALEMGWGWNLFFYWILPSRVALFILAYAFDFLPHYPHEITKKENRYKTTAYLYTPRIFQPLLSLIIFYQNYHLAHHLKPQYPFYRYGEAWNEMKDKLLTEEIIIRHIFPEIIEKPLLQVQESLKTIHPQLGKVLQEFPLTHSTKVKDS